MTELYSLNNLPCIDPIPNGETLGNYIINELINKRNGFNFYLASRNDGAIKQKVIIKVENHINSKTDRRQSSNTEAQYLFDLSGGNENICTVYDTGITPNGHKFIVMEYIEGMVQDLYFEKNNTSIIDILKQFVTVCETIGYIHQQNIIHANIKPENILVTDEGKVKIIDFGISKKQFSQAKKLSATVDYASPEQLRGKRLNTSSDIYSIGATLYKALTGHRLFESLDDDIDKVKKILSIQKYSFLPIKNLDKLPLKYRPFSNEIIDIIKKCISINSSERYKTSHEISKDINRFISLLTPLSSQKKSIKEIAKVALRNYKTFSIISTLSISIVTISILLYIQKNELLEQKKTLTNQSTKLLEEQHKSNALLLQTQEIINYTDPRIRMRDIINVKSMLVQGELKLNNNKEIPNNIKAKMFLTLGDSYFGLTEYLKAEKLYTKAFNIHYKFLDELSKDKIESQVKIMNSLNMQKNYDKAMTIGGEILKKLTKKGIEHSFEVEVLFSFSIAMRRVALTSENFGTSFNFNKAMSDIKQRLWEQLSPTQRVKLLSFQINETYYSFGDNNKSATSDLDEEEYKKIATPLLKQARKYALEGLNILKENKVENELEIDLLMWIFRIDYELRNQLEGDKYAELAISRALHIYGPGHIKFSRLYLIQYAMYAASNVRRSLNAMKQSYEIIDNTNTIDSWERYYYLDLLSQAYLDAGNVDNSQLLIEKLFIKIGEQGLDGITKRAFDGLAASLLRYTELNEMNDFPVKIQKLFIDVMNKYDDIWPGWLTKIDKETISLITNVITKQDPKLLKIEADKIFLRIIKKPQKNNDASIYTDRSICVDLIRIYHQLGLKDKVRLTYQYYKTIAPENDSYMLNKISKVQTDLRIFSVMKKYPFVKNDIIDFKQATIDFLDKNNLVTTYYQNQMESL